MMTLHLATVAPAAMLGTYLIFWAKGTATHRLFGKIYMILMLITALASLFIPATVGPQFIGHFWVDSYAFFVGTRLDTSGLLCGQKTERSQPQIFYGRGLFWRHFGRRRIHTCTRPLSEPAILWLV